jgi:hypothetical protein
MATNKSIFVKWYNLEERVSKRAALLVRIKNIMCDMEIQRGETSDVFRTLESEKDRDCIYGNFLEDNLRNVQ